MDKEIESIKCKEVTQNKAMIKIAFCLLYPVVNIDAIKRKAGKQKLTRLLYMHADLGKGDFISALHYLTSSSSRTFHVKEVTTSIS